MKDNHHLDRILTQIANQGRIDSLDILELDDWFYNPTNYRRIETRLNHHCAKADTSFQQIIRKRRPVSNPHYGREDIAILGILANNPRISLTLLGKKVGMSADAIKDHIAKLVDQGIIGHFFANLNPYILGLTGYIISMQVLDRSRLKPIIEFLMQQPQMQGGVLKYTGAWNLQAILMVKDTVDLRDFEEKFISLFGDHIHKYIIVQLAEQTYYPLFPAEIQQAAKELIPERATR